MSSPKLNNLVYYLGGFLGDFLPSFKKDNSSWYQIRECID